MLEMDNFEYLIAVDPENKVKFLSELNEKFLCRFCGRLLNDPIQTERGELACGSCYFEAMERNPGVCPIDHEPIEQKQIFPDKSVSREIGKLRCLCDNEKYGCQWKGAYNDINEHEKSCNFAPVECEGCKEKVSFDLMQKHKSEECAERSIYCPYCSEEYTGSKLKEKALHEETCCRRPVQCPFDCGQLATRDQLLGHMGDCDVISKGKKCPFAFVGCNEFHQSSLSKHMKENEFNHACVIISKFVLVTRDYEDSGKIQEQLRSDISRSDDVITQLKNEIDALKSQSNELIKRKHSFERSESKIARLKEDVEQLARNLEEQLETYDHQENMKALVAVQNKSESVWKESGMKQLVQFNEEFRESNAQLQSSFKQVDQIETQYAHTSSTLSDVDLKVQLLEYTSYTGRIVWKIEDVTRRIYQAKKGKITALHSPPAFTHRFGYKFCTRFYLNGDGCGKGKSLSVFFVLMRSTYDELLEWPFCKRITFRLINVEDSKRSQKESFVCDRTSQSFRKPTREMNMAAGCPNFLDLSRLDDGFIVDDCLFLETLVENLS